MCVVHVYTPELCVGHFVTVIDNLLLVVVVMPLLLVVEGQEWPPAPVTGGCRWQ